MVTDAYYIPAEVERLWDRMNGRFGIGRQRSFWGAAGLPAAERARVPGSVAAGHRATLQAPLAPAITRWT